MCSFIPVSIRSSTKSLAYLFFISIFLFEPFFVYFTIDTEIHFSRRRLNIDASYMNRIIRKFEKARSEIHKAMNTIKRHLTTSDIWVKYLKDGVHQLIEHFDLNKDCIYILEYQGTRSGCAAITHIDDNTAQFRYFFLEPEILGLGAGGKLLDIDLNFCRKHHYKKVLLWNVSAQTTARRLYQSRGFEITATHETDDWEEPVLEESWNLEL